MWLKKLRLLKFNKKVAATPLAETFGYFKPEVLAKEKQRVSGEAHLLPQTHQEAVLGTEYATIEGGGS